MNLNNKNNSFKVPESYFEHQSKQLESLAEIAEVFNQLLGFRLHILKSLKSGFITY
jgi:hypothetical protein